MVIRQKLLLKNQCVGNVIMHYAEQQKYITSGLAVKAAKTNRFKVIKTETHHPNYCFDCNTAFFNGSECKICGSENVAIRTEDK